MRRKRRKKITRMAIAKLLAFQANAIETARMRDNRF